jgi:acetylornithine deacetylase/succinyl-diaminopimelate desuccinylase-like protein
MNSFGRTTLSFVLLTASLGIRAQDKSAEKKYQAEIKAITEKPAVKKAFQTIMELEPQTRKDHILLTEIPSPPFKEMERAKHFAEMLKAAGVDTVWIDNVGNVIGRRKGRGGSKKTVVMEAHLDTVFPEGTEVKVTQRGDTLFAPGVADDTRGLAVVLAVVKSLNKAGIETDADVLFMGVVGEEGQGDLRGVKNLFSDKGPGKIDSYIAIDGWNYEDICHRALGSHRYRITFNGPGGHSSEDFGLVNPHNALGRAIHYWSSAADSFSRAPGVRVTYNVGVIGGGTSVNAIPFASWMEVDMRSESPERVSGIDQLLQNAIQKALAEENKMKQRGKDLTVDVKLIGDRPSGRLDSTLPLIQRAKAVIQYAGATPVLSVGSTNSNIPISKNIPAITIGTGGRGDHAHSLHEWWVNDKGYLGIQDALLILLAEAGMAK